MTKPKFETGQVVMVAEDTVSGYRLQYGIIRANLPEGKRVVTHIAPYVVEFGDGHLIRFTEKELVARD